MILAKLIERIEVDRDYHLTIRFFISLQDFEQVGENNIMSLNRTSLNDMAG